jgi:hypothetical protein
VARAHCVVLLANTVRPVTLPRRRADESVTTREVGKGKGLRALGVPGLVEAAGGTVTLDTSVTRGVRFVLELLRAKE